MRFRAFSGEARSCPKAFESARKHPKLPETARNCSELFRAVSKLHDAALDVSCWALGPLLLLMKGRTVSYTHLTLPTICSV
eukprot:12776954-Alexandrium_andersonii.AAC.1